METTLTIVSKGFLWLGICLGVGFILAVIDTVIMDPLRRRYAWLRDDPNKIRALILAVILLQGLTVPAFAETQYHTENADGSVSVVIERTATEQQMAEHAYTTPEGHTMYFLDEHTGLATTAETFQAQVGTNLGTIHAGNVRLLNTARSAFGDGSISDKEFAEAHMKIKMADTGLNTHWASVKKQVARVTATPDHESTPERVIKVVSKPRVLVSQ